MMAPYEQLLERLADQGWAVADDLMDARLCEQLRSECRQAWAQGLFRQAGIGRGAQAATHTGIRGDAICWLEPEQAHGATARFLEFAEALRGELNRNFFLGLNNAEFHFARYPAGQGYKTHVDQHRGQPHRKISFVLYLNSEWAADDEGELCLYPAQDGGAAARILPLPGRVALFRSDTIPHEVRPCKRTRWSLTGWFRSDPRPYP
ncbi:SM-20-related protein [Parapusillimonas granuli]|nr:2OG-Fe(II) oxygenase [Parapusillimonas granuli]MBB5216240.1 SM-20-related protein [Parapusillimonas granuli]MEB2400514.1 2OG-Fe(II) oxygenase [Alcaligenaceae bacterium]